MFESSAGPQVGTAMRAAQDGSHHAGGLPGRAGFCCRPTLFRNLRSRSRGSCRPIGVWVFAVPPDGTTASGRCYRVAGPSGPACGQIHECSDQRPNRRSRVGIQFRVLSGWEVRARSAVRSGPAMWSRPAVRSGAEMRPDRLPNSIGHRNRHNREPNGYVRQVDALRGEWIARGHQPKL